jgi:TonB family protein
MGAPETAHAIPRAEPEPLTAKLAPTNEILTSALVILVITAAVLLGVIIGVRQTARRASQDTAATSPKSSSSARTPTRSDPNPTSAPSDPNSAAAIANVPRRVPVEPPVGGLIVSQNGKVIYRTQPSENTTTAQGPAIPANRPVHRVDPKYPEAAKSQHVEGAVVLEAHIRGDGTVGNVSVVTGDPLLTEAATEAVKQWRYQPYTVDGQPVERQERITLKFSLPAS